MCPRNGGLRVYAGLNVVWGTDTLVIPDIGVGENAKGLSLRPEQLALVVEVTSPSTRRRDLTAKRDLYRDWEVPMIIVDRSRMPSIIVEGELPGWVGDLTI